jgi:hypothetical protein
MSLLLIDNLFSPIHYPDVVLSANQEATDFEAARFSTLRREDHWSPTSFNADAWAKATHAQLRAMNMIVLWVHNLLGEAYRFQVSNDDFVTSTETVVDITIPATPGTGHVDDALGVVTEDLMWIKRVPTRYAKYFRHYVPAMGASQRPEINGIVGPAIAFDRDMGELVDATDLRAEESRSARGVVGRGDLDVSRSGSLPIQLPSVFAYEDLRFHLQRYEKSPGLLIFDEARAEQAVMVHRPLGRLGFAQSRQSFYPAGQLHFEEHDPA